MPHIQLTDVSKSYPPSRRGGTPVTAVDGVSVSIERGEVHGVIGYSGAGKSTLVRLINGLEPVTAGSIEIDGVDITALPAGELRRVRQGIGMIFQRFNLLRSRSIRGNVAYPLEVVGMPRAERAARVDELLRFVGLEEKADAYPEQLSGGQQQRVGIARALAASPSILLADEATSALDPETSAGILQLLLELQRERDLTLVIVTHQLEVVRAVTTHVAVLEGGQLVESGETAAVLRDPQHTATRALLDAHRPQMTLAPGETLRRVTLPDLTAGTLAALARSGARLVQAEPHPQGVDVWLAAPAAPQPGAVPA